VNFNGENEIKSRRLATPVWRPDPAARWPWAEDAAWRRHYITALPEATQRKPEWELAIGLLLSAAENGGIVMMARIAVTQALTGRKVAMPELRFVDGAVFLGPLKGRANAAAVLILCDITRRLLIGVGSRRRSAS
jgi:hypothetical protein